MRKKNVAVPARFVSLETPKHILLNGLYLGPDKPRRLFIFVHGLSGSIFSRHELITLLVDGQTGVLTFNNRGSGVINGLKRKQGAKAVFSGPAGSGQEVFTDCVDDLDGAVCFARQQGVQEIYLVGHSTGCQKSVYYLSRRPKSPVKGAVLLAPVSDFASLETEGVTREAYRRALLAASRLVKQRQPHTLLPAGLWRSPIDAQRFLSLYTPDSAEEIFCYASARRPVTLRKVAKPLLIALAGNDQYHDRPAGEIAAWFQESLVGREADIVIIDGVEHGFGPEYSGLARMIKTWADNNK